MLDFGLDKVMINWLVKTPEKSEDLHIVNVLRQRSGSNKREVRYGNNMTLHPICVHVL